ncbi:MAG: CRISPR-associated protein [Desulfobacterales bacterium S5133MH4]|nr:MAG: CRISPR-associated protein [Desulfobacterales bacterium S5133MH4]
MRAMIISVGGTPDPVVTSILKHKPDFVCFFASQQSLDMIGEIKKQTKAVGHNPSDYKVVCENAEDLLHCYAKALECAKRVRDVSSEPDDVVVDYTGGTKTMSAALALATVAHGYQFSYVGGEERTKNGLGLVVSGKEVVRLGISPWQVFAVEEKKQISLFISSFQYEAAISVISKTIDRLQDRQHEVWSGVMETLQGYLAWDSFDHKTALRKLSNGLKRLEMCERFGIDNQIQEYTDKVRGNFDILNDMNQKTHFFKLLHPILLRDIVSNARRRYQQNKYDDAVARLYRALEMAGQIAFEHATGTSTCEADPEKLPQSMREEYVHRYRSPDDKKIRIPLFATFRVLKELQNPSGVQFGKYEEILKKVLSARNGSILAHGIQPIDKETYERFASIIEQLFLDGSLIEFPQLNL